MGQKSAKPFYELVFIVRQDASSLDVDKITDGFKKIIEKEKGTVIKTEYWGLRGLKYKIGNNKKGHYVLLGIGAIPEAMPVIIEKLQKEIKLNESIIRFIAINVDEISSEPSPILKNQNLENESVVDVTINKDLV